VIVRHFPTFPYFKYNKVWLSPGVSIASAGWDQLELPAGTRCTAAAAATRPRRGFEGSGDGRGDEPRDLAIRRPTV